MGNTLKVKYKFCKKKPFDLNIFLSRMKYWAENIEDFTLQIVSWLMLVNVFFYWSFSPVLRKFHYFSVISRLN